MKNCRTNEIYKHIHDSAHVSNHRFRGEEQAVGDDFQGQLTSHGQHEDIVHYLQRVFLSCQAMARGSSTGISYSLDRDRTYISHTYVLPGSV